MKRYQVIYKVTHDGDDVYVNVDAERVSAPDVGPLRFFAGNAAVAVFHEWIYYTTIIVDEA